MQGRAKAALQRQLAWIGTFVHAPLIRRELGGARGAATPRWARPSLSLSLLLCPQEGRGLCLLLLLSLSLSLLSYVTPPTESFQRRGT